MKPGPRPMPSEKRKLTGDAGRRGIPENEPMPDKPKKLPMSPRHLDKIGRKEWNRIGKLLHKLGLLTDIDMTALAAYCSTYATWVEAQENIKKHGVLIKAQSGFPMQSPYLTISNKAMSEMRKWLVEFGMTPSSRTRVKVEKPKEKNRLEKMQEKLRRVK